MILPSLKTISFLFFLNNFAAWSVILFFITFDAFHAAIPFRSEPDDAAVAEALLDINTGENRILRADIVQDCGKSLNESIDVGQIEGGFVQGLGWLTCEELYFSQEGKLLTTGPSTYKLPGSRDIPKIFNVKLLENADNEEKTIFRSKAVGEPPLLLAISHFLAVKEAIKASSDTSNPQLLNSPATPTEILRVLRS